MPDLLDAVGELLRPQSMRVHPLADLTTDPPPGAPAELRYQLQQARRLASARFYTVHAPCLLAQLRAAVAGTDVVGANLRGVARSRLPLSADALDLWVWIVTAVHTWANILNVDRHPDLPPDPTPAGIPPVGLVLRAVAAAAIAQHADELADRVAHDAHHWANQIRSMLAGPAVDERLYPIRGAHCSQCGATTASEPRDDGQHYRVPAVQVRVMREDQDDHGHWHLRPADSIDQDGAWLYQMCLACGANGWVPYTTETGAAA